MNRRIGMWIAIICILVVGVSVTKMTSDFVSSNGVEAAAIANVMDTSIPITSGMGAVESMMRGIEETIPEMAAEEATVTDSGMTDVVDQDAGEAAPAAAMEEFEVYDSEIMETEAVLFDSAVNEAADFSTVAEEEMMAAPKAPKSPLDPLIEEEGPHMEEKYVQENIDSDYFLDRFSLAETSALTFWDMANPEHAGAYYSAAEQEHVLWEHELNLVYSTIRDRLNGDEADQLNASEMEWIKERDMYANKSMSAAKNKAMQSTDYLQALTQMTKDRCYWLVEEYREVLDLKE